MEKQSIVLANWIKNAELINKSALCKKVGLDRANLDKYLQRGEIPEKFIADLGKALYDYGYKTSIEKQVAENNKPGNKAKIEKERNETSKFKAYDYSAMPAGLNYSGREAWKKKARAEQDKL